METTQEFPLTMIDKIRLLIGSALILVSGIFIILTILYLILFIGTIIPIFPSVPESSWGNGLPYSGIPIWDWPGYSLTTLTTTESYKPFRTIVISFLGVYIFGIPALLILGKKGREYLKMDKK